MPLSKFKFTLKHYWDFPVFPLMFLKLFRAQNYFDKCETGGHRTYHQGLPAPRKEHTVAF